MNYIIAAPKNRIQHISVFKKAVLKEHSFPLIENAAGYDRVLNSIPWAHLNKSSLP
ncbi:hypothetical protein B14911_28055 [Bacillus sp. NRRL B-14911]|nr:hypothetical protein B14911_28055 [Bacillus sp. NRRL B-14911]